MFLWWRMALTYSKEFNTLRALRECYTGERRINPNPYSNFIDVFRENFRENFRDIFQFLKKLNIIVVDFHRTKSDYPMQTSSSGSIILSVQHNLQRLNGLQTENRKRTYRFFEGILHD